MIKATTLLSCFLFAFRALAAGGDISGGGELLEDRVNPWFVQEGKDGAAKRVVTYCVTADEAAFGVSLAVLERQVSYAFRFWQDELASAHLPDNGPSGSRVLVGAESFFLRRVCDDSVGIRFQFGILSESQLANFARRGLDPTSFVAVALRDEYNVQGDLQGRGVVYVSPPRGDLGMRGRDLVPDPWAADSNVRLNAILIHELGHVFGLQHGGTQEDVMGAEFPERMVSRGPGDLSFLPGVFKVPMNLDRPHLCRWQPLPAFVSEYFHVPAGALCLSAVLRQNRMILVSRDRPNGPPTTLGEIAFEEELVDREETLVNLWLPDERTLFRNVVPRFGRILRGPTVRHRQASGTFASVSGEHRSVQVHPSPTRIQVGGVWNGKIVLDLFNPSADRER